MVDFRVYGGPSFGVEEVYLRVWNPKDGYPAGATLVVAGVDHGVRYERSLSLHTNDKPSIKIDINGDKRELAITQPADQQPEPAQPEEVTA